MNTGHKHTQGPWFCYVPCQQRKVDWREKYQRLMVLHPDRERLIARCDEGFINSKGEISIGERIANARLIAAAPEMLEALEALADCKIEVGKTFSIAYSAFAEAHKRALSAIAKAKGESTK